MRAAALAILLLPFAANAYPLDGAVKTGIRRLTGYKLYVKLPSGGQISTEQVALRLRGVNDSFDIAASTPRDSYLQQGIEKIFAERDPSYSIAVLEITDPAHPKYAALREEVLRIPGSVGKLCIATGFFGAVQRLFPSDTAAREKYLRETFVKADSFVHVDAKTVPFYNDGDKAILNRRVEVGDKFNLYEWLDHMLSQSSNAAGSFLWEQTMLLYKFRSLEASLKETPKTELAKLSIESLESALTASGINTNKLRIGTFLTSNAERAVPGTKSYGCPSELMRWLVKLEQGKIVDPWSSLELKRLMFFSRPRYRYASSPALDKAAVYFKSGSLFECDNEPGYKCEQYKGNKVNLMHSVAIVESGQKVYLVALMSNVMRLNSAVEHQTIATLLERLIQARPAAR